MAYGASVIAVITTSILTTTIAILLATDDQSTSYFLIRHSLYRLIEVIGSVWFLFCYTPFRTLSELSASSHYSGTSNRVSLRSLHLQPPRSTTGDDTKGEESEDKQEEQLSSSA